MLKYQLSAILNCLNIIIMYFFINNNIKLTMARPLLFYPVESHTILIQEDTMKTILTALERTFVTITFAEHGVPLNESPRVPETLQIFQAADIK